VSPYAAETLQDYIFAASEILLMKDGEGGESAKGTFLEEVCEWLREHQLLCKGTK